MTNPSAEPGAEFTGAVQRAIEKLERVQLLWRSRRSTACGPIPTASLGPG